MIQTLKYETHLNHDIETLKHMTLFDSGFKEYDSYDLDIEAYSL